MSKLFGARSSCAGWLSFKQRKVEAPGFWSGTCPVFRKAWVIDHCFTSRSTWALHVYLFSLRLSQKDENRGLVLCGFILMTSYLALTLPPTVMSRPSVDREDAAHGQWWEVLWDAYIRNFACLSFYLAAYMRFHEWPSLSEPFPILLLGVDLLIFLHLRYVSVFGF